MTDEDDFSDEIVRQEVQRRRGWLVEWLTSHGAKGIVRDEEVVDFTASSQRVLRLMMDMQWHSADEIRIAASKEGHPPASEGLRRLRDLRPLLRTHGMEIEKTRADDGGRLFVYRIERQLWNDPVSATVVVKKQGELF
tara:strand:- start:1236 stop:1649 length:414 start_codon:yes stop_codon:yes gene_type:complete